MTTIIDIADAVVAELNATTFSQPFEALRAYRPQYDLGEMKDLHVTVVPKGISKDLAGRNLMQTDYQVDVAVQQKPVAPDDASLDALMSLVNEIAGHFEKKRLGSLPAVWVGTANSPIYSVEHLDKFGQFTSVLTLTFRVME